MAGLFDSLADRTRFAHHFCAVFNYILQPTEATSDVISRRFVGPVVPEDPVKFGDLRLNLLVKFHLKPSEAAFLMVFSP